MVAQRRQGLFKHLAPMTWAEAQQQDVGSQGVLVEHGMPWVVGGKK